MKNINARNIVNVDRKNPLEIAIFRQDNTNILEVELFDGRGQALNLDKQTVYISARRINDGAIFEQKTGIIASGNKVTASLMSKMCNRVSRLDIQFKIKDKEDGSVFNTSSIYITIERNNVSIDSLEEGGYIEILDEIERAEEQRKANEVVRRNNEDVRNDNEKMRIENEVNRNTYESGRQKSEQLRILQENERLLSEKERIRIFNDIITGSENSEISKTIEAEVIGSRGTFKNLNERLVASDTTVTTLSDRVAALVNAPNITRPKRFTVASNKWTLNSNSGLYEYVLNHKFDLNIEDINVRFFSENENTLQTYRYIDKNNLKIINDDTGPLDIVLGEYIESNYYTIKEMGALLSTIESSIVLGLEELRNKTSQKVVRKLEKPVEELRGSQVLLEKDGFDDSLYICIKTSSNTYTWKEINYL